MPRKYFVILASFFLFYNLLIYPILAQKSIKNIQLNAEEQGCILLVTLANKGWLTYKPSKDGLYINFDRLVWNGLLHKNKVEVVKAGMHTSRLLNKDKQNRFNITTVMIFDMTTHEELAYGFIGGISPGKFEILK